MVMWQIVMVTSVVCSHHLYDWGSELFFPTVKFYQQHNIKVQLWLKTQDADQVGPTLLSESNSWCHLIYRQPQGNKRDLFPNSVFNLNWYVSWKNNNTVHNNKRMIIKVSTYGTVLYLELMNCWGCTIFSQASQSSLCVFIIMNCCFLYNRLCGSLFLKYKSVKWMLCTTI